MKNYTSCNNENLQYGIDASFGELLRQNSISFSITTPVFPWSCNREPVYNECKGIVLGREILGNDHYLAHRQIKAWFHANKEESENTYYLSDKRTHVHIESLLNEQEVLFHLNLTDPHTFAVLNNPNSAIYTYVKDHLQIPSISLHLGYSSAKIRKINDTMVGRLRNEHFVSDSNVLSKDDVLLRIISSLNIFKKNLLSIGYSGDLLVEILSYFPDENESAYEYITEPEFIHTIISETGFGIALNTANIISTAMHAGYTGYSHYIKKLIDYIDFSSVVREINVSVPVSHCGRWYDRHLSLNEMNDRPESKLVLDVFSALLCAKYRCGETTPLHINFESPLRTWNLDLKYILEHIKCNRYLSKCDSMFQQKFHHSLMYGHTPLI
jgi:hypothetical protein